MQPCEAPLRYGMGVEGTHVPCQHCLRHAAALGSAREGGLAGLAAEERKARVGAAASGRRIECTGLSRMERAVRMLLPTAQPAVSAA